MDQNAHKDYAHQHKDYDSLYYDAHFTAVVWN